MPNIRISSNMGKTQLHRGCRAMMQSLGEMTRKLRHDLEQAQAAGDVRGYMRRNAGALYERIAQIEIQLSAVLGQCRGVLPKHQIDEARTLQGNLAKLRDQIDRARRISVVDWNGLGQAALGLAGAAAGLITRLLQQLPQLLLPRH